MLLDHVTGSLGFAHRCVVATHLLHCTSCRNTVSYWEDVAGRLVGDAPAVAPPPGLLDRCLGSIERDAVTRRGQRGMVGGNATPFVVGDIVLPPSLRGIEPGRLRWLAPGISHSTLWRDEYSRLHLIRVGAGVALPAHRHRGLELTCVLGGVFRDGSERYETGDVSEEDDADESNPRGEQHHVVVAEPSEDCVCIVATTGRLEFRGPLPRMLQAVLPF